MNAWVETVEEEKPRKSGYKAQGSKSYKDSRPPRQFDDFGMSLSRALKIMSDRKLIVPWDKPATPKVIGRELQEWCEYHQAHGHPTDNCYTIKNKLQDLIDSGTIPNPNVVKNPLPKHEHAGN